MANHGKVVPFRRPSATARRLRPMSAKRFAGPVLIVGLLAVAAWLALVDQTLPSATDRIDAEQTMVVTWVDGDSGRLDGREFRLHGVDAPEGSSQRAKCVRERELSVSAREAARGLTKGKPVRVARRYGKDDYGRELVDLALGDGDVASQLLAAGMLKRWNFEAGQRKPDWCG